MSIAHLMDHYADVYDCREVKDAFGGVSLGYEAPAKIDALPCTVQVKSEKIIDPGPGETVAGTYVVYIDDPSLSIIERDVLDVTDGPEAPCQLRVVQVRRPRNDHIEALCIEWRGVING